MDLWNGFSFFMSTLEWEKVKPNNGEGFYYHISPWKWFAKFVKCTSEALFPYCPLNKIMQMSLCTPILALK